MLCRLQSSSSRNKKKTLPGLPVTGEGQGGHGTLKTYPTLDSITSHINLNLPIQDPTWIFFLVLLVILFTPLLLNKLRIPHIIGMILAGVLIGEHGLNLLSRDASFEIFGKVGMFYIMFLAGLEIDMEGLKNNFSRGACFGLLTAAIPFLCGFAAGRYLLDYSISTSLLLACIFASHTLVSYSLVSRYGVHQNPAVTISVAATMIALLGSLLVLAVIAGRYRDGDSSWFLVLFVVKCAAYFAGVIVVFPRIIRWFFRNYRDRLLQFTFVITMVFFAAIMAEVCGIEGLVGAFIAGLIFNRFIPRTIPLMNRIEFVGNALFIPYFLVGVGMMVNLAPLFTEKGAMLVVAVIVVVSTVSKLLASELARRIFHFTKSQGLLMFGLTEAHAAGAIAMVMVGTSLEVSPGVYLMNNEILDGVVVMILFSCIISSIVTDAGAKQIKLAENLGLEDGQAHKKGDDEKILIPIKDNDTLEDLIHTAIMIRNNKLNRGIICLNVVYDNDIDDEYLAQKQSKELLSKASDICAAADVRVQVQSRLAVNLVNGVVHSLRENDASEIIVGMHHQKGGDNTLLGSFAQGLLQGMSRQLMIVRYNMPVTMFRKVTIVVPERAEYEVGFYRWVERLARFVDEIGCRVEYNAPENTGKLIKEYNKVHHPSLRDDYNTMYDISTIESMKESVRPDHLLVVIAARPGCISYTKVNSKLPRMLRDNFNHCSLMMIFPDMNDDNTYTSTFSEPIK